MTAKTRKKAQLKKQYNALIKRHKQLSKQWMIAAHKTDQALKPAQSRRCHRKERAIAKRRDKIDAKLAYLRSKLK